MSHSHHHAHPGRAHPPAAIGPSVLRFSVWQRLLVSAAAIALLWVAVAWGMAQP